MGGPVALPKPVTRKVPHGNQAATRLFRRLNQTPTPWELAQKAGFSRQTTGMIRDAIRVLPRRFHLCPNSLFRWGILGLDERERLALTQTGWRLGIVTWAISLRRHKIRNRLRAAPEVPPSLRARPEVL
jgi:hypothetical protein